MDEPGKYVIRASVTANGVVERSDVVGAVFGQTEGLLGDEFDIRSLQDADRVGRIEVDIESVGGRSAGDITIATDMDRAETAVLAAALETIERVGPARASIEVNRIEDVRAAKRRRIVDRARALLAEGFEDVGLGGRDIVAAVRNASAPAEITAYAGLPAGPTVEEAADIVVVEGRADVLRLLEFGITNVIGVEGTGISEEIAALTEDRTVTAFFDGDRGGDLLLVELAQVGDVDFVTFAPPGRAVEDLSMAEITDALARKVPYEGEEEIGRTESPEETESGVDGPTLRGSIEEIMGEEPGAVRLLAADHSPIASGELSDLRELLSSTDVDIWGMVIADTVEQAIVDAASRHGLSIVIGRERGDFVKRPIDVRVLTYDDVLADDELPEGVSA